MARQLSPERTDQILKGAMQRFLEQGYANTSVDDIAKASKVARATIYNHFESKEALFVALLQRLAGEKFKTILELKVATGSPRVVLTQLVHRFLTLATESPDLQAFMRVIIAESNRFPELANTYITNIAKPGITALTDYFAQQPQLQVPDPEATARLLIGSMVYHVVLQEVLGAKGVMPFDPERLVTTVVDLIVSQFEVDGVSNT
ncbi:MAG: TetR/AcrR family transcriptional regulator [Cyanobacteria bacterium P01_H01_bin.121]